VTALIRTELLRLRTTRSTWVLLALGLVLSLGWAVAVIANIGGIGAAVRGSGQLRADVLAGSTIGLFPVLLLGVVAVAGEFHHRTVTPTFLVTPRRWRVLAAKAAACALTGAPVAVVLLAVTWTVGVLAGAIHPTMDTTLLATTGRSMLVAACWALLGVGVGAAVRNQTVAVLVPLVWLLLIEPLMPAYGLAMLVPWSPGGATIALSGGRFAGALPAWAALLLLVGYALALLVPSGRVIARRDIT
jgi:ABC-type transport system involved in multi-copper enzyme maturation permease subunit